MAGLSKDEIRYFKNTAKKIRKQTLDMIYRTGSPHIGSSFSAVDILTALYFRCLCVSPRRCRDKNRDRFILSKGHGCAALYAVLAQKGFLSSDVLNGFSVDGGTLEQHPTCNPGWGIEVSTGSLGHGLSVGAGMAIAAKADRAKYRVFVLLSDGETNEGLVWEAAMLAAQRRLNNLVAIIDYNGIQALGRTEEVINLEPFGAKWRSFGWAVREIDGHDFSQIISALEDVPFHREKPSVIIARTVKGKGVSFMEDKLLWHYRCPDEEEYKKAAAEVS